jgi:hypothetical protein
MSDATMCRLVDAESYEAFTDEIFGDDPQQLYEDAQCDGIGYFLSNHTTIEGATTHALEDWFERKGCK